MDHPTKIHEGYSILEADARELIRKSDIDPLEDSERTLSLLEEAIREYESRMIRGTLPLIQDFGLARQQLFDSLCGYGPLQKYLDDSSVEEIWINSPSEIFIARSGESELTGLTMTDLEVRNLVERMLKVSGRRLDLSSPFVDLSLKSGARVHVAIPDVTRKDWAVNIRKFIAKARRIHDLVQLNSLSKEAADFLDAAVASGLNILISGATQAGKTTMLNCLSASIGPRERVITCEEIFEVQIPLHDVVGLQCRQPNLEGKGEIPLRRLVKEALRMRPDRLIIGEVREAESLDMLIALNSGLPGLCTIHANSARDAITKMCTLPLLAGENISPGFVVPTVASCFDLVVHCTRDFQGRRSVEEILAVGNRVENGIIETSPIFRKVENRLECVAAELPAADKFLHHGYRAEGILPITSGATQ